MLQTLLLVSALGLAAPAPVAPRATPPVHALHAAVPAVPPFGEAPGAPRVKVKTKRHAPGHAGAEDQDDRERRSRSTADGERLVQTHNVGEQGSLRVSNIAGDVIVSGGGGGEIRIEAVKRGRGRNDAEARSQLANVNVDITKVGSRVEVETTHRRNSRAWVDYTITVPTGTTVDLRSVSGSIKVTTVKGEVRAESVSGDVTGASLPRATSLKSVSGDVEATAIGSDAEFAAASVSGNVVASGVKARTARIETVSGDITLKSCTCGQANLQSVSGDLDFAGSLERSGRYAFTTHSGDVHLGTGGAGFELDASTFSGTIRSESPMTTRSGDSSDRRGGHGRTIKATIGGGGAYVEVNTFSGDIVVSKQ